MLVRTDHESLKYFLTQKHLGRRLARFHDDVAHFDVKILYRPGTSQIAADALSRREGHADVPDKDYEPLYSFPSLGKYRETQKDIQYMDKNSVTEALMVVKSLHIDLGHLGMNSVLEALQ